MSWLALGVWLLALCALVSSDAPLGSYPHLHRPDALPAPTRTCNVLDFGAKGDGVTKDTAALQHALKVCAQSGGFSRVILPAGHRFLSGALNLSSAQTLSIEGTLLGSTDPRDYPVVPALPGYGSCRDSGFPANHSWGRHQALLSGWHLRRTAVSGGGTIDGQGLVPDPLLGTSWVDRMKKECLDFGRPRVYEPMFRWVFDGQIVQAHACMQLSEACWNLGEGR